MIEPLIIVTNNPMCKEKCETTYKLEYIDGNVLEVFRKARDYVHLNHRLLTHPLVSSIKPNEIPYRTVIISKDRNNIIDMQSLDLIENSISTTEKFLKDFGLPKWTEKILEDFMLIDFDIIYNAIKR
ncbi:GrdX family protein [Clostridium swellfunianum]|uniref:GrdX family protein n=1 Tax=Clostridium swellfunianum TaxID=1367462 RepID=UPI0020302000|nr:GrdX family protein [Clostridium swellfunianum]MCM0648385.1 GrdX family protein [Clostridium swellfunianum]